MKVVLFCGGLGTRLREYSDTIPKPLAPIGPSPIVWHLMRYYAHHGHTEFVLCLGYGSALIREFFDRHAALCRGWTLHLVETGMHSTIGERLRSVASYVRGDELFLANYSDGLTDLDLGAYVEAFRRRDAVAAFVAVRASQSYHMVTLDDAGTVTALTPAHAADVWVNGGFFVFRPSLFDYLEAGEELVDEPFHRLMRAGRLYAHKHRGFWAAMDTYKDKVRLDERLERGDAPWEVWK